ncbi:MerR family transcriptional regulator [Pseudofrankia inefficax]|uniref:MerR family transcriptional regulator n=1 Tax=Pseudofrankia inefficax (strain DSM 45817 / CECT 9037 / DDB 130130 / EuI1c) TaxID=298654 RepID=UPI00030143FC|nr:MerR family transcriptional regulator [Pseudofrankia inefficax]
MDEELVPIDEVARRVGLRASAIRYYEQRGLIAPAVRSAGRRWYRPAEIRRLAVIRYWQRSALMSLDDIADLLAGRPDPTWARVIETQIESLQAKADRLRAARALLEHTLEHHRDAPPDGCPHYEQLIWTSEGHAGHHDEQR